MRMMHGRSLLLGLLILTVGLPACGVATSTPLDSPVETVTSPLDNPTIAPTEPPTVGSALQAEQRATDTPDPNRTPVAIVKAEITPDREVITIKNVSEAEQDISKWTLFNREREPLFVFPDGVVLQPGESVQVYSAIPEEEAPEEAYFWTDERVWLEFPANVMLLNQEMRLVYWHTESNGQ